MPVSVAIITCSTPSLLDEYWGNAIQCRDTVCQKDDMTHVKGSDRKQVAG